MRKPNVDASHSKTTGVPLVVRFWLGWILFWLAITGVSHWVKPEAKAAVQTSVLTTYANDFAGALRPEVVSQLNFDLAQFETETSTQIALAIYPESPSMPVDAFTIGVAEASRLGRKGLDNGAILSVFAKDKVARMEVGYGLEGVLTDVDVRRILESKFVPTWNAGDHGKAVNDTLLAVMALVRASYTGQKMPGTLTVFWRQVRVGVPKLFHGALPKLVAVPWDVRLGSAFFGGLLMALSWMSLVQVGRSVGNAVLSARQFLPSGLSPAKDSAQPRGLLQWLNSPSSAGLGAVIDLIKVAVALIAITSILIGVVVLAGGGAYGGAGSLVRW